MGETHNELTGDVHGVVYQARNMTFLGERSTTALSGLPRAEPDFTGRTAELARLADELRPDHEAGAVVVSAVAGLGGVGKTTLAIRAAHDAVAAGWFPGGVLFLNLHGYSPDGCVEPADALATLLRDLGVPVPPDAAGRESLYRSELARRTERILIVLDNASSSEQVRPLLPNSSAHRVIVTSRHSLGDLGATTLDLNVLANAESAALIENALQLRHDGDRRVLDEPEAAARLGGLCGHLPLAISIAASMLADDPEMPISELVDALREETTRLKELVYGENVAVRAAFDLSFHRLTEAQQRMFALLALHPGKQVGVRSAAALADVPVREAKRTLDDLRRAHVALSGKPRGWFRFHDLVRLYAVEHANRLADRSEAVKRLLQTYHQASMSAYEWVSGEGEQANDFTGFREAVEWFDVERPSFRPVVDLGYETGHHYHVRLIGLAITKTWMMRGADDDLVHVFRAGIAAGRAMNDRTVETLLLLNIGRAQIYIGDLTAAETALHECEARASAMNEPVLLAACHAELGDVRIRQGRHHEGIKLLERALAADPQGPGMRSYVLGLLGAAHAGAGDLRTALEYRQRAVDEEDRPPRSNDHASRLIALAEAHTAVGEVDQARTLLEKALEIQREIGNQSGQLWALAQLAVHHAGLRRYDTESEYRAQRLALIPDGTRSEERADALLTLGKSLVNAGQDAEATEHLRAAADLYAELEVTLGEARSFDWLSVAEHRLTNLAAAEEASRRALTSFRAAGDDAGWAGAARELSSILLDSDRWDEAKDVLDGVLTHDRTTGDKRSEAETLAAMAGLHTTRYDFSAALEPLNHAVAVARETGDRALLADTLTFLSNTRSNARDHTGALDAGREALALAREAERPDLEAMALLRTGRALTGVGDHRAALEVLTEALPHHLGKWAESTVRYHFGLAHRELGEFAASREQLHRALELERGESDTYNKAMTLHQLGLLHRDEGDVAEARRLGEQAFAMLTEAGHTEQAERTRAWLGELW